jgi:DNA-binding transcriptional ArsR family regulator
MNKECELCSTDTVPPDIVSQEILAKVSEKLAEYDDELAELLKVLASPVRLRVLKALEVGDLCVCVLVDLAGCKHSLLSYHLNMLKYKRMIESRREGNFQIYGITLKGKRILRILDLLELELE